MYRRSSTPDSRTRPRSCSIGKIVHARKTVAGGRRHQADRGHAPTGKKLLIEAEERDIAMSILKALKSREREMLMRFYPLLWAHYADKHRGVCLQFELTGILEPVTYVDAPIRLEAEQSITRYGEKLIEIAGKNSGVVYTPESSEHVRRFFDAIAAASLDRLLRTKCKDWQYEDEVRQIRTPSNPNSDGLHFAMFSEAGLILKAVLLGLNCKASVRFAKR